MKYYFYKASVYEDKMLEFVASGVKGFTDTATPIEAMEEIVSILKKRAADCASVIFDQFNEVT